MTDAQSHAERLREMADNTMLGSCGTPTQSQINDQAALLAGAEALEAQGRWRLIRHFGQSYMIPFERSKEWSDWCLNREAGEYTAIVPEWAAPVPDDVVITGWEG